MGNIKSKIRDSCKGVRPRVSRRTIILDLLIDEYCSQHDKQKSDVLEKLGPAGLRKIVSKVDGIDEAKKDRVLGLTNRSLKDYIKTLRYFEGC